ncbi:MAG TPA: heme-binding protein [Candidatus Nitrosotalea sp.]|nr:heme-binding protein [Candidatus Nitrosotalea sp.]
MPLELDEARTLIAATLAHGREMGIRIAAAVVDEGGHLQALERMDGAFPLSSQVAEAKAVGAAMWHRDGASLAAIQAERPAFYERVDSLVRMPMMPGMGSALIRRGDRILGAIGVSGAMSEQDLECANAGLSALLGS